MSNRMSNHMSNVSAAETTGGASDRVREKVACLGFALGDRGSAALKEDKEADEGGEGGRGAGNAAHCERLDRSLM